VNEVWRGMMMDNRKKKSKKSKKNKKNKKKSCCLRLCDKR
jgi:hypothetical protein